MNRGVVGVPLRGSSPPTPSHTHKRFRPTLALLRAGLVALVVSPLGPVAAGAQTVVYLVRHAEPSMGEEGDRRLNLAGRERAHSLLHVLESAGINRILSTEFRRTRETVAPLAEALGLTIESYDPRALDAVAQRLRSSGGRVVVAGHSNTTPELVRLLGGEPGSPIVENYEFDRLYQVVIGPDGSVTTNILRYGAVSGR